MCYSDLQLEENPESADIINSIFRPIHSIKGTARFFLINEGIVYYKLANKVHEVIKLLGIHFYRFSGLFACC